MKNILKQVLLVQAPLPHPLRTDIRKIMSTPPLGLGLLATILQEQDIGVEIIDFHVESTALNLLSTAIKNNPIKIIGISCMTESYRNAIRLSNIIKTLDEDITIILGGPHVSFQDKQALEEDSVDIVVRGEGEYTFLDVVKSLLNNREVSNIKGITYKTGNQIVRNENRTLIANLDKLPIVNRNLFNLDKYTLKGTMLTSRGCPGKCIFCAATALSGGAYRTRSVESIIYELEYLSYLEIKEVFFADDTFTADVERLNNLMERIIKTGTKYSWYCESRVDAINEESIKMMKLAGCKAIQFGIETGSDSMLKKVGKEINLKKIHKACEIATKYGIKLSCSFIIGLPNETPKNINDSISLAIDLQAKYGARVIFSILTPYPGTPIFNYPSKFGINILNNDFDKYNTLTPVISTKHLSQEMIKKLHYDATRSLIKSMTPEAKKEWKKLICRLT